MDIPIAKPLIFPKGVRFPRKNELPPGNEEGLERISRANIVTGYIRDDEGGAGFKSYFEANVHAPNVFEVFRELAESLLPDIAAPILGLEDEDPVFGPYTTRDEALTVFQPHIDALQNDGFLEFGIIFASDDKIEEIYVKASKYLQIWTNQPEIVSAVLIRNSIPRSRTLEFIDEYPMVSLSLDPGGNAHWPSVTEAIKTAFDSLPAAPTPNVN